MAREATRHVEFLVHFPILLNFLGHAVGVTAFGTFLALLVRHPSRGTAVPALAAGLAMCWNLGSAVSLLIEAGSPLQSVVATGSLAVLSLLPCTLLHLALEGDHVWLDRVGFAIAACAAAVHVSNALGLPLASPEEGISLIRYGFSATAMAGAVLMARESKPRRGAGMRFLAAMALFLLAASFVHFGGGQETGAWLHELVFHHAGIPLALFVILQDYRFLLLDVFLRLAIAGLLAAAFAGVLLWLSSGLELVVINEASTLRLAVFVIVSGCIFLSYPSILRALRNWLGNRLFPRKDMRAAVAEVRALGANGEDGFAERAARIVARFFSAERWKLLDDGSEPRVEQPEAALALPFDSLEPAERSWAEATVPLRQADGKRLLLVLGSRRGGARYLSLDLSDLDRLASEIARRSEDLRRQEQDRLMREAELSALRAQINPHFLFNALNALNALLPDSAEDARRTVLNLADIFRYSIGGKRQLVPLDEELEIVQAYLEIERLRFGHRLRTRVVADEEVRNEMVPALSVQPLVENAVKHGTSHLAGGGEVDVLARRTSAGFQVDVIDNGAGFDASAERRPGHGLQSVERRLHLCFGGDAELFVKSGPSGSRVGFRVRSSGTVPPSEEGSGEC